MDFLTQVSIRDVAQIAGVSIATVSRCINDPERVLEKTRSKVQEAILRTGYSPNTLAQSFRRGKTHVILVVLPSVGMPFFTEVMKGIRSVASSKAYSLLIYETPHRSITAEEISALAASRLADGIVLLASLSPFDSGLLSPASRHRPPIVGGCETTAAGLAGFPSVHIDDVAAARAATNYLLSLGHSRIAFLAGQARPPLITDRESGYRAAMHKAGMAIEEGWIVEGGLTIDGAIRATRSLLHHRHRPTAVFCASDEMAMAAMHEIKAAGLRIPRDISIVGFDDIRFSAILDPPLTTVRQPAEEIGERVTHRLLREIDEGCSKSVTPEIIPHKLIVRQSSGAPAA